MVEEKEKRERLATSTYASKVSIDRISKLPDEVLGVILCFLTMKEAVATSILCRSWKYSWMYSRKMDFDQISSISSLTSERKRAKFVRWVDRVLLQCLHQRSTLEEFRLMFYLNESHAEWINDWLTYALTRKVERLELNLIQCVNYQNPYKFPYKMGNFPANFKLLKKLGMHYVSVSGEAVEFFLRNCPLLEQVSVSGSRALSSLEIVGTFPSFKCLEISLCNGLKSVTLRDSNVVTIKYRGSEAVKFVLVNVPLVTQLWISLLVESNWLKHVVEMFSSLLPQLEMLKICCSRPLSFKESREFMNADVEMRNLKQLVVNIGESHNDRDSLLPIINLIRVAPCLHKLVVEAPHIHSKDGATREIYKEKPRTYFYFKEMEFVGYRGVNPQVELIKHFANNCVALETMIVDPRCFNLVSHRPWDRISLPNNDKDEILAREYAEKQLKEYVSSKINLIIL